MAETIRYDLARRSYSCLRLCPHIHMGDAAFTSPARRADQHAPLRDCRATRTNIPDEKYRGDVHRGRFWRLSLLSAKLRQIGHAGGEDRLHPARGVALFETGNPLTGAFTLPRLFPGAQEEDAMERS